MAMFGCFSSLEYVLSNTTYNKYKIGEFPLSFSFYFFINKAINHIERGLIILNIRKIYHGLESYIVTTTSIFITIYAWIVLAFGYAAITYALYNTYANWGDLADKVIIIILAIFIYPALLYFSLIMGRVTKEEIKSLKSNMKKKKSK